MHIGITIYDRDTYILVLDAHALFKCMRKRRMADVMEDRGCHNERVLLFI